MGVSTEAMVILCSKTFLSNLTFTVFWPKVLMVEPFTAFKALLLAWVCGLPLGGVFYFINSRRIQASLFEGRASLLD